MLNLKEILNSEACDIAQALDAKDGSYDGIVDIGVLNEFLEENGFKKYQPANNETSVLFIDVVKMIYSLKQEQIATGASKIKVDFDPADEIRKARKKYERW